MPTKKRSLAVLAIAGLLSAGVLDAHTRTRAQRWTRAPVAVIVIGNPHPTQRVKTLSGVRPGVLDLNVRPRATEVWIDGDRRGTCAAFDGHPSKLTLAPGFHTIRLVTPDGIDVTRDVRVRPGVEVNVGLDLR